MKKTMALGATLFSLLIVCSAVSAYKIGGYVYFDTAKTRPARCADVFLWFGSDCSGDSIPTTVDNAGYYEFTGLSGGDYSLKAKWGHTVCAQCDTTGPECDTVVVSACTPVTVDDEDLQQDFVFDIDCECEGD